MLEFDDIQHLVLTRVPAVTGRYEFLSFQEPSQGRDWLAGIIDKVESAQAVAAGMEEGKRWVSVVVVSLKKKKGRVVGRRSDNLRKRTRNVERRDRIELAR